MKDLLLSSISIAILAYLGLGLILFLMQRSFIYFPTREYTYRGTNSHYIQSGNEKIKTWVLNENQTNAIIYFGGNAEAVENNMPLFAGAFPEHTLYLVNYRGYGGSSGQPSETALFQDAISIYDELDDVYDRISVIGRSLGSGVATYLAAHRKIDKLVLVTPYDSILNVAQASFPIYPMSVLLKDKFDSLKWVNDIESKTMILIAEFDEVIPGRHSHNLAAAFPPDQLTVEILFAASHNTVSDQPRYMQLLEDFL
ncbi:MAG: alpha/beta hydrolase [Gammaproteobacteria bacterium]|nr:alpha/beta hydrolase [Gammaproteobacteria bacterium]